MRTLLNTHCRGKLSVPIDVNLQSPSTEESFCCFIELKYCLNSIHLKHSDVVAPVLAERDGADTFKKSKEWDGLSVYAVLTT
jgi:hypothetical protein